MVVTDDDVAAGRRMSALRGAGRAAAARHDRRHRRPAAALHAGVRPAVPVRLSRGPADAPARRLGGIGVGPSGLGPHWLSADAHGPALLRGALGTEEAMAHPGPASYPGKPAERRSA